MTPDRPAPPYAVLIADDHPVVRIGVRNILASAPEFRIVKVPDLTFYRFVLGAVFRAD